MKFNVWSFAGKSEIKSGIIGNGMEPGNEGVCGKMAESIESKTAVCEDQWEYTEDCGIATCDLFFKINAKIEAQTPGFAKNLAFNVIEGTIRSKIQEQVDAATGIFPSN